VIESIFNARQRLDWGCSSGDVEI